MGSWWDDVMDKIIKNTTPVPEDINKAVGRATGYAPGSPAPLVSSIRDVIKANVLSPANERGTQPNILGAIKNNVTVPVIPSENFAGIPDLNAINAALTSTKGTVPANPVLLQAVAPRATGVANPSLIDVTQKTIAESPSKLPPVQVPGTYQGDLRTRDLSKPLFPQSEPTNRTSGVSFDNGTFTSINNVVPEAPGPNEARFYRNEGWYTPEAYKEMKERTALEAVTEPFIKMQKRGEELMLSGSERERRLGEKLIETSRDNMRTMLGNMEVSRRSQEQIESAKEIEQMRGNTATTIAGMPPRARPLQDALDVMELQLRQKKLDEVKNDTRESAALRMALDVEKNRVASTGNPLDVANVRNVANMLLGKDTPGAAGMAQAQAAFNEVKKLNPKKTDQEIIDLMRKKIASNRGA